LTLPQRQGESDSQRRVISGGMLSPPAPILPRTTNGRTLRLSDISPLELARQLTILEFDYFVKIKPVECLDKRWNRVDGDDRAPNVRNVIHTANVLSGWVSQMVLSDKDPKGRASIMKYFVATAMVSTGSHGERDWLRERCRS
jgi:son of sevenless-like protein